MASRSTSRAPEAVLTGNTSSRQRNKKESKSKPRKASTRRATNKERAHQIRLDYARFQNGLEPELPDEADFAGISRVPRPVYYMRIQKLREEARASDKRPLPESLKAPAPWVPDPYADSVPKRPYYVQEGDEVEEGTHEPLRSYKRMRVTVPVPSKRPPLSQEFIRPEDEPEDEEIPDYIRNKTPPRLMNIPSEIRMEIFRYLLTVKKPIAVHGGWKQVYWTKDLQLSTGILRVCKVVHEEASMVLYGANTFLYRLRDPTFNGIYIDNLAINDSRFMDEDESDSDSEYEEEEEEYDEDEEDGPFVDNKESSINIEKYAHMFRTIAIEAEANRYSKATQDSMVAAINVFRKPNESGLDKPDGGEPEKSDGGEPNKPNESELDKPDQDEDQGELNKPNESESDKPDQGEPNKPDEGESNKPNESEPDEPDGSDKPDEGESDKPNEGEAGKPDETEPDKASRNIHTLTVRIMPLWDRQHDQPQQGRFTFVDFFLPDSPVIEAIKSVDSQLLHVDILTRHTSRRSAHFTVRGSGSCRLTINRRHEQALNYFKSDKLVGVGDRGVRWRTAEMARRSAKAIDALAKHIGEQCSQRKFDQDTTMDMDIDSPDWLDLDQGDDGF